MGSRGRAFEALLQCDFSRFRRSAPRARVSRRRGRIFEALLLVVVSGAATAQGGDARITIAAVGDMMIGTAYPENRLPPNDGAGYLDAVKPYLSGADLAFGNLEGVLADGGEPGKKCSNPAACYRFRMPTRYAQHFVDAGFDLLSLANNHARDFGEEGRTTTMRTLQEAGILYSGRVGNFASFEKNGLTIAMLSYAVTKNSNMMLDYLFAERTVGYYAGSHDIVIVTFHGGGEGTQFTNLNFEEEEYYGEPRGDVIRFARMVVDAGADLVLGHGPHVIRAMERYNDRLIAYSLGNFATHFGISISGIKGIAPILIATLDGNGRFVEGEIISTRQQRPNGPQPDSSGRALKVLRDLSVEDFGEPGLEFRDDGALLPAERAPVTRRMEFGPDDNPGDDGPFTCKENWFWLVESSLLEPGEVSLGEELESIPWRREVDRRLGIENAPGKPAIETEGWCEYVDEKFGDGML